MVDSHHLIRPIELTGVGGVLALFNTVDEAPPAHILIPARPGLLRRRLLGVVPRAAAGRGLIQMAWTTVRGPAMPPMGNPDDTVRPETLPSERPPEASSWELRPLLRLLLAADPVAPSVARQQVRRWLAALAWPTDQLQDIVLALSEAVTNAAEHAYRDRPLGMIELRGGIDLLADYDTAAADCREH